MTDCLTTVGKGQKLFLKLTMKKQSNVPTKFQTSSTTTIDEEGRSWGAPLTSNDTNIPKVSDPDNNNLSCSAITKTNNGDETLDKECDSTEQNNKSPK